MPITSSIVVAEEAQSLRPDAPGLLFQSASPTNEGREQNQSSQAGVESSVFSSGSGDKRAVEESIIGYEETILLNQSTHSFLFTEPSCSLAFNFALGIITISYTCLLLALFNNLTEGASDNPFNVPVGVTVDVKIAQYLALLIGLIMEEEIPESLYLLRMISEESLKNKAPNIKFGKFIFCSFLRVVMGYLFIFNVFIVVIQATGVIDIFYDVMALQFLQQVDDIAFRLAKIDVFGKHLKRASTRTCFRTEFDKLPFVRRKKMTIFVKVLYLLNLCALMTALTVVSIRQKRGDFYCDSITVYFGDDIWENAIVWNSTGGIEEMDLIYSYFNGVYVRNGTHAGRPVYREQNKFDGSSYQVKTGAIIRYCKEEKAWIFMHEDIRKDRNSKVSDCPWLLRSPDTSSFNLLEVSGDWSIWTGTINSRANFQTTCNKCYSNADCNYHGTCTDRICTCDIDEADGYSIYTGTHCEFSRPCAQIEGTDGGIFDIVPVNTYTAWKAYGRGVYRYSGGGNTSFPDEDALLLVYSGSRWFGAVFVGGNEYGFEYWLKYAMELHAFWDRVYTKETYYVSDPSSHSDPIAIDFFQIGRRGAKYGPLGELIPLQDPPGSGYFECTVLNVTLNDFISGLLEEQGGKRKG